MMVANHFDVRWVDGYSAVSDVPSSLAAVIEKLAAELPSSGDRIELAVRDVRRSDGTTTWVGLLRFVVAVSSAPRPLGYLHAAVMPPGHRIDLDGWRLVIERRYGAHPEDRIRTLYEELAEATKDLGRDRLHALAVRPEDVRDQLVPFEESERPPVLPRTYTRPGSRPPKGLKSPSSSPPGAAPPRRPSSQSMLPLSMAVVELPEPSESVTTTEEMARQDLANDVTQPMTAPSGAAAPVSGEHPQHRLKEQRGGRAWWAIGAAGGVLVLLLGVLGWLAHRHVVLARERDRLADEMRRRSPDREAWDRLNEKLAQVQTELEARRAADKQCELQILERTQECKQSLSDARMTSRTAADLADQYREAVRINTAKLQELEGKHADLNSKHAKLKNDLTALTASKDEADRLYREEQKRTVEREAELKRLRTSQDKRDEQLRLLCRRIQSAPGGEKLSKECQGYK